MPGNDVTYPPTIIQQACETIVEGSSVKYPGTIIEQACHAIVDGGGFASSFADIKGDPMDNTKLASAFGAVDDKLDEADKRIDAVEGLGGPIPSFMFGDPEVTPDKWVKFDTVGGSGSSFNVAGDQTAVFTVHSIWQIKDGASAPVYVAVKGGTFNLDTGQTTVLVDGGWTYGDHAVEVNNTQPWFDYISEGQGWQDALNAYTMDYISGLVDPLQIFNGTHVINTWDTERWTLANTPTTTPPVFEWIAEVKVFSSGQRLLWAKPDYAHISENKMPSQAGGTWTVDADGWVNVQILILNNNDASKSSNILCRINGKDVMRGGVNVVYKDTLEVHTGDVVTIEPEDATIAGTMAYCSIKYIPPLLTDTNLSWPEMPDGAAVPIMVPDYARKETTNRINAKGGKWTVERTGYIVCNGHKSSANGNFVVTINGSIVSGFGTTSGDVGMSLPYEVTAGDVVQIDGTATLDDVSCYFIPPRYINKELPVVVEKNGSYSLEEVKTAETWIDGKPIYKRTFALTSLAAAGVGVETIAQGISRAVRHEVVMHNTSGSWSDQAIYYGDDGSVRFAVTVYCQPTGDLRCQFMLSSGGVGNYANRPYYLTVYYTKNS